MMWLASIGTAAQAAKDGKDPELLILGSMCPVMLSRSWRMCDLGVPYGAFIRCDSCPSDEVDVAHRPRRPSELAAEWKPKTRELANQAAALRPQPWQSHVRRTQSMKTNTGVMIRENVKLGVKASIARDKSRPLQNACIASELHLALAIYVGNAAGPCKEDCWKGIGSLW